MRQYGSFTWAVLLFLMGWASSAPAAAPAAPDQNLLWYEQPASEWSEALPLGNGRLGAVLFGSAAREHLQLNEESLWAGEPVDAYPPNFAANLERVQRLVLEGKIDEARRLGVKTLTASPTSFRSYEPLGDLWIDLPGGGKAKDYRRELDLATGVARVRYSVDGAEWLRETFISAVDDVLVMRLSVDSPGRLEATVRLTREQDATVDAAGDDQLHMDGQVVDVAAPEGHDDNPGGSGPGGAHMKFAGRLRARVSDGTVHSDDNTLVIKDATQAVLLFTAATDYNLDRMDFDRSINPGARAAATLSAVAHKTWSQLLSDHRQEHQKFFNRVSLDLGGSAGNQSPTDERLAAVKQGGEDPGLTALYQFGRYLLMSSSRRPGRLPANLQGIWNKQMWAPWEADYHLNINLQMNYWPADLCNLSETLDPLSDWLVGLAERGRRSARKLYDAPGWVGFTTTNPFGRTTPGGSTKGSQFVNGALDPLSGAWMAMTLWRHYEFTGDRHFLAERAYPVLKGASQFLLDYLVDDENGHLVIVPSTSPENSYIHPKTGKAVRITRGSTYHMSIVRVVFNAVIDASKALRRDAEYRNRLREALTKMPSPQIGDDGTIQEWIEDYRERNPGHRHISHLIGLHPFALITPEDKRLFSAAEKTVQRRLKHGGGHTGWSRAWVVNFYARLLDGNAARKHIVMLLRKSTLPNLFDVHPPFQIDGNFGGCAGIAEMLVQSHTGTVHLLPALPDAWPEGAVKGLRARGGFIVDATWKAGDITSYRVHATRDATLRLRVDEREVERTMRAGEDLIWSDK